jgi:hypothetical protein
VKLVQRHKKSTRPEQDLGASLVLSGGDQLRVRWSETEQYFWLQQLVCEDYKFPPRFSYERLNKPEYRLAIN